MCWAFSRRTTPIARPFLAPGGQLEIAAISPDIVSVSSPRHNFRVNTVSRAKRVIGKSFATREDLSSRDRVRDGQQGQSTRRQPYGRADLVTDQKAFLGSNLPKEVTGSQIAGELLDRTRHSVCQHWHARPAVAAAWFKY